MIYQKLSYEIIGCCIRVHKTLGGGLLENCYHNALHYDFLERGLKVQSSVPYIVKYHGKIVGEYFADLVVENKIILELKSVEQLGKAHTAQMLNYLHIAHLRLGLLCNFRGPVFEFKRLVL